MFVYTLYNYTAEGFALQCLILIVRFLCLKTALHSSFRCLCCPLVNLHRFNFPDDAITDSIQSLLTPSILCAPIGIGVLSSSFTSFPVAMNLVFDALTDRPKASIHTVTPLHGPLSSASGGGKECSIVCKVVLI